MKKFALIFCALALVATLTLSGCGEKAGGGGDTPHFTGTWKLSSDTSKTLTINANKTFSGSYGSGTYTYTRDTSTPDGSGEFGDIVFSAFEGARKEFEVIYGKTPGISYRMLSLSGLAFTD